MPTVPPTQAVRGLWALDRSKRIDTSLGAFSIHHVAPELFTGFDGSADSGYLATPEKALFDTVYIRAPRGGHVYFPELTLPTGFDAAKVEGWIEMVAPPRLRTIVAREVERALGQAAGGT